MLSITFDVLRYFVSLFFTGQLNMLSRFFDGEKRMAHTSYRTGHGIETGEWSATGKSTDGTAALSGRWGEYWQAAKKQKLYAPAVWFSHLLSWNDAAAAVGYTTELLMNREIDFRIQFTQE